MVSVYADEEVETHRTKLKLLKSSVDKTAELHVKHRDIDLRKAIFVYNLISALRADLYCYEETIDYSPTATKRQRHNSKVYET
jgi:hypothetical protein